LLATSTGLEGIDEKKRGAPFIGPGRMRRLFDGAADYPVGGSAKRKSPKKKRQSGAVVWSKKTFGKGTGAFEFEGVRSKEVELKPEPGT